MFDVLTWLTPGQASLDLQDVKSAEMKSATANMDKIFFMFMTVL